MMFTDDYYVKVIKKYGYSSLKFHNISFNLPGIDIKTMKNMWLCSFNIDNNFKHPKKVLFTTGIGLSGPPHLGTISQIMRAIKLAEHNDVQIVLGDVDAYTGRKVSWQSTQILKEKYKNFINNMGFNGIIRDQSSLNLNVYITHSKISKYFSHTIANQSEEELHDLYVSNGKVDKEMTFNREYSLSLMCADFISPLINCEYSDVVVFLGLDEHKYVQAANETMTMMSSEFPQLKNKSIKALYSPLISGFKGFPKMSKSFPESSINIEDSNYAIKKKIINDDFLLEDNSTVTVQLMKAVGNYTEEELEKLTHIMQTDLKGWEKEKEKFSEKLIFIKENWINAQKN